MKTENLNYNDKEKIIRKTNIKKQKKKQNKKNNLRR